MKLYDQSTRQKQEIGAVVKLIKQDELAQESVTIDKDIITLNGYIKTFNSLVVVDNHIANENYSFIDKGNYVLYNEYIKAITSNLDVKYIPVLAQETVNTLPTTALNHIIALEGFIGDIWAKIKQIFSKIYQAIKGFLTKHFTRLGRLKNKLTNLLEVLKETDKDLTTISLNSVPGAIASKYPHVNNIDSSTVMEGLKNVADLVATLAKINESAAAFAKQDIVDKDTVAELTKAQKEFSVAEAEISKNEAGKKAGLFYKEAKHGVAGEINHAIDTKNKPLKDIAKASAAKAASASSEISKITDKADNAGTEEELTTVASKEFETFLTVVSASFNAIKDKPLIKGIVIKSVKSSKEDGIELETDTIDNSPSEISLGGKSSLVEMVQLALQMIDVSEKYVKVYAAVNDDIMKNIDKVDKLVSDLDKRVDQLAANYKKILVNKVKVRLNLAKTFFNNYNKVCKNIYEMALDSGDGVVAYSTLSLKHFG